ncbi:MAG TPA: hypothetical protein VNO26_16275 [Candidatus Limnocylindria bacterium]|nr:hypothetical protein [Candidatus Limnocylindria bacterium]
MTNARSVRCLLAVALGMLLVAGAAESAAAKKPKVAVTLDGKGYKYKGRYVVASTSGVGTIIVATKPVRPGKILRTIGFGCAYDLPNETFPWWRTRTTVTAR